MAFNTTAILTFGFLTDDEMADPTSGTGVQTVYDVDALDEALRLLCQARVKLTADCSASDSVTVGSNAIFAAARAVTLRDDNTSAEAATVSTITGSTGITLTAACTGAFTTAQNATIGWATPPLAVGSTGFVADGRPRLIVDTDDSTVLPSLVVWRVNSATVGGGNVTRHIRHTYRILVAREISAATTPRSLMQASLDAICNVLEQDREVGGQAWWSRVIGSNPDSTFAGVFSGLGGGNVQVGQIDFEATQFKYRTT